MDLIVPKQTKGIEVDPCGKKWTIADQIGLSRPKWTMIDRNRIIGLNGPKWTKID